MQDSIGMPAGNTCILLLGVLSQEFCKICRSAPSKNHALAKLLAHMLRQENAVTPCTQVSAPQYQTQDNKYRAGQHILRSRQQTGPGAINCSAPCQHSPVIQCVHIALVVIEVGKEEGVSDVMECHV